MRTCPRCSNGEVQDDGYCGLCRECTLPGISVLPSDFAVLMLRDLKLRKFQFKIEMEDAVRKFKSDNVPFIALVYHHGGDQWTMPEVFHLL